MENNNQVTNAVSISTQKKHSETQTNLSLNLGKLQATPENGILVAEVFNDPITSVGFSDCIKRLAVNFGIDYAGRNPEKLALLFEEMLIAGWTNEWMKQATRYFMKNNKYPTWTIADWFDLPLQKLYTHSQYTAKITEFGRGFNSEIQWYDLEGVFLWAYKKEGELPFKKKQIKKAQAVAPEPEMPNDENFDFKSFAEEFKKKPISEIKETRESGLKPLQTFL